MDRFQLWADLNGVDVAGIKLDFHQDRGHGFVLTEEHSPDQPLMTIPRDLVLSAEAVAQYAKVDKHFGQLLEIAGRQSLRQDLILFLLIQQIRRSQVNGRTADPSTTERRPFASTPWTDYLAFLPSLEQLMLPSLWQDDEQLLLQGTSLDVPTKAKQKALGNELGSLEEKTTDVEFWYEQLWEQPMIELTSVTLADAWFRSRCLELPQAGVAMVPVLDMINHSSRPNALYEENADGDVVLRLRPDREVAAGDEITISYGKEKTPAEMLFSYGFIDSESKVEGLTLRLEPMADDPLGRAKLHAFAGPPVARLAKQGDHMVWNSPFAYLMCLNEEDGLDFRLLQDPDGERALRVFWQEEDVTERVDDFETLIKGHPLEQIFRLRTVAVLQAAAEEQLDAIKQPVSIHSEAETVTAEDDGTGVSIRRQRAQLAKSLRAIEGSTLEAAVESMEKEKSSLLEHPEVLQYLAAES